MLIELNADHSFVGRRKAVWAIQRFQIVAVVVSRPSRFCSRCSITVFLARRIMRPLSSAVRGRRPHRDRRIRNADPAGGQRRNRHPAALHDGDAGQYPRHGGARKGARAIRGEPARCTHSTPRAKACCWSVRTAACWSRTSRCAAFFPSVDASAIVGHGVRRSLAGSPQPTSWATRHCRRRTNWALGRALAFARQRGTPAEGRPLDPHHRQPHRRRRLHLLRQRFYRASRSAKKTPARRR